MCVCVYALCVSTISVTMSIGYLPLFPTYPFVYVCMREIRVKIFYNNLFIYMLGCHLFCVNPTEPDTLASGKRRSCVALAIGKKVRLYGVAAAKQNDPLDTWSSSSVFLQGLEFTFEDDIKVMCAAQEMDGGGRLCVGLKGGDFVMIDTDSGMQTVCPIRGSAKKIDPVACITVPREYEDEDQEFVICYNQVASFRNSSGQVTRPYEVKFNSIPDHIAYVAPFLLGFTMDSVEIVTLINGNLIKTLPMPFVNFLSNSHGVFFTSGLSADGLVSLMKISQEALSGTYEEAPEQQGVLSPGLAPGLFMSRQLSSRRLSSNAAKLLPADEMAHF